MREPYGSHEPGTVVRIDVPTEDGRICIVEWEWEEPYWILRISEQLIRQAPEAIAATLALSLLELRKVFPG